MDKINEFKVSLQKGQLIGIDIGLSSVKMCLLSNPKKFVYRLEKYAHIPLSEATIIEDEIQRPEEVIDAVIEGLKDIGKEKRIACLGMSGPNTVTKRLQVPGGAKDEVEDNILWEAEQYIPFGADDAEIGFSIIEEKKDEDIVDAIVGAAKIDVIETYSDYLKEAGLNTRIVDLNVFAMTNLFELVVDNKLDKISEEGSILIDFGAQYTTIVVYKNGGPVLSKEINLGGVLITEEIQRNLGVSYEEAEDLKVNGDEKGNLLEDVIIIIEEHINKLLEELKKILNFYIAAGSSEQVGSCYITGGGSNMPGIKEALEDLIDLDVEFLNPFEAIEIKGKFSDKEIENIASSGVVALGLGLRSV